MTEATATTTSRATTTTAQTSSTSSVTSTQPSTAIPVSLLSNSLRELPNYHKAFFQFDCLVKSIIGDGACLYRCLAQFVYGDESHFRILRKNANEFLGNCFSVFYRDYVVFPLSVTIGGQEDRVILYTEDQVSKVDCVTAEKRLIIVVCHFYQKKIQKL